MSIVLLGRRSVCRCKRRWCAFPKVVVVVAGADLLLPVVHLAAAAVIGSNNNSSNNSKFTVSWLHSQQQKAAQRKACVGIAWGGD